MPEISRKLQKIASAVYLVTGFFAEQEPLRWRLRSYSVDLVSDIIKDKTLLVREVIALLLLAKNAGLISDANHDILVNELSSAEYNQEASLENMFSRDKITSDKSLLMQSGPNYIKDSIVEKRSYAKEKRIWSRPLLKKNNRQSVIVSLLKRKKEVMIKDISPLINDCSDKTIQRELLTMVEQGVLRKIGEKRWSRYTLAHP